MHEIPSVVLDIPQFRAELRERARAVAAGMVRDFQVRDTEPVTHILRLIAEQVLDGLGDIKDRQDLVWILDAIKKESSAGIETVVRLGWIKSPISVDEVSGPRVDVAESWSLWRIPRNGFHEDPLYLSAFATAAEEAAGNAEKGARNFAKAASELRELAKMARDLADAILADKEE